MSSYPSRLVDPDSLSLLQIRRLFPLSDVIKTSLVHILRFVYQGTVVQVDGGEGGKPVPFRPYVPGRSRIESGVDHGPRWNRESSRDCETYSDRNRIPGIFGYSLLIPWPRTYFFHGEIHRDYQNSTVISRVSGKFLKSDSVYLELKSGSLTLRQETS